MEAYLDWGLQVAGNVDNSNRLPLLLFVVLDELQLGAGQIILVAEKAGIFVGVSGHGAGIADRIDAPNVTRFQIVVAKEKGYKSDWIIAMFFVFNLIPITVLID